ncbi:MAG: hypothetical protein ACRYHC_01720 [Janthinobacterium lividum]
MTDDPDTSASAVSLLQTALALEPDPLIALLALMQAAASLCLVRLTPATFAAASFDGAAATQGKKLAQVLGVGKVRQ